MIKKFVFCSIITLFLSTSLLAQAPPPPPGNAGSGGGPVGGPVGAPIDGGTTILLLLAVGYGAKKLRKTGIIE